ncbi:MAG: PepSY-associated TM helix domain-containing protein [Steroidobacteraceae bacterium]
MWPGIRRARPLVVWLHRWTGLVMVVFLVIVGLTGSLLAFNTELERVFAPRLFAAERPGVPRLDLAELAERAQVLVPEGRVQAVTYSEPDQVSVWFEPRTDRVTGRPFELGFTEFFMDPWTGRELGWRVSGDLAQGLVNIMPFIYDIHWRLLLGDLGQWVLGIVALLWTVDCVVSVFPTLPPGPGPFWRRWWRAWQVRRRPGLVRISYDLHRAGGLWLWPLLFVFAWSSVMMNMRPVYERTMSLAFDYQPWADQPPASLPAGLPPRIGWHQALRTGDRLMAEQAALLGFTYREPLSLMYFPDSRTYLYEVRGSRDLFDRAPKGGGTDIVFDGDTGQFREISQPTGEHLGNTLESWLYALHMARVFGRPYQVIVTLLGVGLTILCVTGVHVWWRKHRARVHERRRAGAVGS